MVKDVYAVQLKSSFSNEVIPYTLLVTGSRDLARKQIDGEIWADLHDIYDTWNVITPDDIPEQVLRDIFGSIAYWDDTVLIQREKTGEIMMFYINNMKYIY